MTHRGNIEVARTVRSLLILLACPVITSAKQPTPKDISSITIHGLLRMDQATALHAIGIPNGSPAVAQVLDAAVARLLLTGKFLAVSYKLEEDGNDVRVVFYVSERQIVSAIRFEGNTKFRDSKLASLVTHPIGQLVDWLTVRSGREAIVDLYRNAGYQNISVSSDREVFKQSGELVFAITEGDRVWVSEIRFEGHTAFDSKRFKSLIELKTKLWIVRSGVFDEEKATSDAARIQIFLGDEGFLDARVNYHTQPSKNGNGLMVVFTIQEGTRYTVESLTLNGRSALPQEELLTLISTQVGATAKRRTIAADARSMQIHYGSLGYIDAIVRPTRVFTSTPGKVAVAFTIREGEQFRTGRVVVRGNTHTKDKVIRRALKLYPPTDLFNLSETRAAEQRLLETRLFSSAKIYPVGNTPGVRDLIIDVKEADRTGDFIFGLGVTSNAGLTGNVVIDLKNFDIADPPRSLSELMKLRSNVGAGQRLRLELQPGRNLNRFRIDFTEPYLFDRPTRFDLSAFLFQRTRDGYDERRGGLSTSFGKRFEQGTLRDWSGELALRAENVSVRDIDLLAARQIRNDKGSQWLTSVKVSLVRDQTDNRLVPTAGDRTTLGAEQYGIFGGDHTFTKLTCGYTWFKTLSVDALERKRVLQLRARGSVILGNAPVFERYYAGGTGSIRGFEFRGIGKRDGIMRNNIGDDSRILAGAEYAFPLIGQRVRGFFFLDTASLGSGGVRASVGTGIRFTIDLFGPVPFELNLALPVFSDPEDEKQAFSFRIGQLF